MDKGSDFEQNEANPLHSWFWYAFFNQSVSYLCLVPLLAT